MRLRIRFAKQGKIRFTSHRDVARMWERAFRRSGLPVAWSQGFSPRPLLSFGLALPTGCESVAEYLDVQLEGSAFPPDEGPAPALGPLLSSLLPDGVDVQALATLAEGAPSLQQAVTSCSWDLEVLGLSAEELARRVGRLLDASSVPVRRERKGRQHDDDLRPSVRVLALVSSRSGSEAGESRLLRAELATQPRGVRPTELVSALGPGVALARACRTEQWIERDGYRWEPLDPEGGAKTGPVASHASERAS